MAKRDEDSQADMEVGMTTAERRRRRRRGGSLRVPSDNVPRTRAPTAPPAPRPEDPSLAMSIAYSFGNDQSGAVPRVMDDGDEFESSSKISMIPVAPEPAATQIDPPVDTGNSGMDFETKTREMSSVDLAALGLKDPDEVNPATTLRMERMSAPIIEVSPTTIPDAPVLPRTISDVDVDVEVVDVEKLDTAEEPALAAHSGVMAQGSDEKIPRAGRNDDSGVTVSFSAKPTRERLQTVALSDADLEELRISRADSPVAGVAQPVPVTPPPKPITQPPPISNLANLSNIPVAQPEGFGKTQQLQAIDIEVLASDSQPIPKSSDVEAKAPISEPMSVPEIDIAELADRADSSASEIDVAVDEADEVNEPPKPVVPQRAQTAPPIAPQAENTKPKIPVEPPPTPKAPPPAPPAQVAKPKPPVAPAPAKTEPMGKAARSKPWFVDLFDEDYLRTLPFLTPQATQAEAEFVLEAMQLAPGAQVLDVGCGYGRHAMELAARGIHMVGLDLSTPLLVRGGEEAHRRGLTINFVRGDMRELDFENQFDAAYSLFSTFGYFDDETNKKTLQNIARALKPNGKVLIEILNRDYLIQDLPTRVWWEGDGCVVLEEVELNYFSSRIQVNRSVVFDDGRQLEQEISVRAYSLHEVGKLMHAAGFRVLEVSGGYQMKGRFFGNQSRHIIVLAERKDTPGS
ncbi:MAG: methyltransferase domain-containing protein [Kofleriaceae bacterium]